MKNAWFYIAIIGLLAPGLLIVFLPSNVFHEPISSFVVLVVVPIAVACGEFLFACNISNGGWRKIVVVISSIYLAIGILSGVIFAVG